MRHLHQWVGVFTRVDAGWPYLSLSARGRYVHPISTEHIQLPRSVPGDASLGPMADWLAKVTRRDRPIWFPQTILWGGLLANSVLSALGIWGLVATSRYAVSQCIARRRRGRYCCLVF